MSKRLRIEALGVTVDVTADDSVPSADWQTITAGWADAVPNDPQGDASGAPADVTLTAGLRARVPASVNPPANTSNPPTSTSPSPLTAPTPLTAESPSYDISASTAPHLAQSVTVHVTRAALAARKGELLLLHAGGIALPNGDVIAFAGPSGRGKTTAMQHLSASFGYVSDESVGVATDLSVARYRKPLSIILPDAAPGSPKQQVAVSSLDGGDRGRLPNVPLRLRRIVLLDRVTDQKVTAEVTPVSLVEGLTELLPQTSYMRDTPRALQFAAQIIQATGGLVRLRYSDATELAAAVPDILQVPGVAESWFAANIDAKDLASASQETQVAGSSGYYRSLTADDAINVEGKVLTFQNGTVRLLSDLGAFVWHSLRMPGTLDELTTRAVQEFGAPDSGQAQSIVGTALDDLQDAGLVSSA